MRFLSLRSQRIVASTLIFTGHGFVGSLLIGTDGSTDPTVTVFDALTDTTGKEIIPTTTFDASALGLNGLESYFLKECKTGCYVKIANMGTGEVVIGYRTANEQRAIWRRQPHTENYRMEEE